MSKQEKNPAEGGLPFDKILKTVLKTSIVAFILLLLFLCVETWLISSGILDFSLMQRTALVLCMVAVFLAVALSVDRKQKNPIALGAVSAVFTFCVFAVLGMIFNQSMALGNCVPMLFSCGCGGVLGGLLKRNKPKKKRKR